MNVLLRNNVNVIGGGAVTMLFAHGFGCDQNMWRGLAPAYADRYRVVLFDLVGGGKSDLSAYDRDRYATLQGHADDVNEIIDAVGGAPVVFVGHSVSATIGMLAEIASPQHFAAQVMVAPSPAYIDDGAYTGGFSRGDIESMLEALESNHLGWSSSMAPVVMGASGQPELSIELTNSFCRTDPAIAAHFARVTFLSDHRADVFKATAPALILQCSDDVIAPRSVGSFLHAALPGSTLAVIDNVGHCPHMSAPAACRQAIDAFLASLPL